MKWIMDLVGGGLIKVMGESIITPIIGYLGKKSDERVSVMQVGLEEYRVQSGIYSKQFEWWGTKFLMLGAAVPPLLHSGAVYFDSTFKFGWAIAKAPGPYEGAEIQILLGVIGLAAAKSVLMPMSNGIATWFGGKNGR